MEAELDRSIKEIKANFITIMEIRSEIIQTFKIVETVIKELEDIYGDYIKNTKEKMKVFGLNPFYFQCRLVKLEHDELYRFNIAIINRMYCEYFKLHKIITEYISETIKENDSLKVNFMYKDFPIYKDLEPFKEYDFEVICKIHETLVAMIDFLFQHLLKKESHMKNNQTKNKTGLFIDNFVNTLNYDVVVMKEKIFLFTHDLEFFHKLHIQYLKRFSDKMLLFNMQLNDDLKLNSNTAPPPPPAPPVLLRMGGASLNELVQQPPKSITKKISNTNITGIAGGGGALAGNQTNTKKKEPPKQLDKKWNIFGKKK